MRIVVIGAGIVGVHVAVALVRRRANVTLIDRADPGCGTSDGSFAWIDASHPWPPYAELRVKGVQAWGRAAEQLGQPWWLSLPGTLAWAKDREGRGQLEAHARLLRVYGHEPARLSVREAREREPDLIVAPGVETVYRFAGEGWVLTRPAIAALLDRGRAAGLRVRTGVEAVGLSHGVSDQRVTGVALGSGEVLASDVVVSCAGRWTDRLLGPAGVEVPMIAPEPQGSPALGLVVSTTQVRSRLRSVLFADGLLVRPDRDRRLLLHSDAHDRRVPSQATDSPPPALAEELLALLRTRLRGVDAAGVEQARTCIRALPVDRMPVVGRALDGLYVVATHSGVTLAPALGELAVMELIDGREAAELARFRPQRFERRAA
jgi:glycine/D-amino acid oxidase-like deaminating enzyme